MNLACLAWEICTLIVLGHSRNHRRPLSGVPQTEQRKELEVDWGQDFGLSRWFKRGWTLQELLAPRVVEFFSKHGTMLGTKASLEQQINQITHIAVTALRGKKLSDFIVHERR